MNTTTVKYDSFYNSFSCTRRKEDPWKTVASGHKVYQCGGWGCDGIIYGYYIERSSTTYPQVRVSNADVFDF